MKKFVLSLTAIMCLSFTSFGQGFMFGAGVQYNTEFDGLFGVQGKAIYSLNETIDIAGSFTYILDDFVNYELDFNAQYKLLELSESLEIYPMAGFSILSFDFSGFGGGSTSSVHIGASVRIPGETLNFYVEPKFVFDANQIVISGGVLF